MPKQQIQADVSESASGLMSEEDLKKYIYPKEDFTQSKPNKVYIALMPRQIGKTDLIAQTAEERMNNTSHVVSVDPSLLAKDLEGDTLNSISFAFMRAVLHLKGMAPNELKHAGFKLQHLGGLAGYYLPDGLIRLNAENVYRWAGMDETESLNDLVYVLMSCVGVTFTRYSQSWRSYDVVFQFNHPTKGEFKAIHSVNGSFVRDREIMFIKNMNACKVFSNGSLFSAINEFIKQ